MKNTTSYFPMVKAKALVVKAIRLAAEEMALMIKAIALVAEEMAILEAEVQIVVPAEMVSLLLVKLLHTQEELTIMIVMELVLLVGEDLVRRLKLLVLKKMEDLIQST